MLNGLVVNKIYKDCDFVHAVSARTGSLEWRSKSHKAKIRAITSLLKSEGLSTRRQISKDLGVSMPTFDKYMGPLVDQGLVVKIVKEGELSGRGKKAYYTLPETQS